jgi:hypothetical protein
MAKKRIASTPQTNELETLIGKYARHSERVSRQQATGAQRRAVDITQELARREKIKNDDAEQNIALKRQTLNRLFRFLSAETALIFLLALAQAIHKPYNFRLDEWSFKLVVTATLGQITAMLFVAVRYLFPKGKAE